MTRRDDIFPVRLNDAQRHGICLRIALGWTTRQVQSWLKGEGVTISYAGLRRYWRRKRWVWLTESLRANITTRPEAQQLIRATIWGWLDAEGDIFRQHVIDLKNDLHQMGIQDPRRIDRYQTASFFLVQQANEVLNRISKMMAALGLKKDTK
jgi:hypothetical protein